MTNIKTPERSVDDCSHDRYRTYESLKFEGHKIYANLEYTDPKGCWKKCLECGKDISNLGLVRL